MSRKIGYARVSTGDQELFLQTDALLKAGVEERDIFKEKISGSRKDRPELERMLAYAEPGDTVIVWKLDRIGRSTRHLIELVDGFKERGIHFISLTDAIDTTTALGELIFIILAALAQFERSMTIERTYAGLAASRARGKKGGRPKANQDKLDLAIELYKGKKHSIPKITELTGISKTTLYRYIK